MYTPPLYHWPKKSLWTGRERGSYLWEQFSAYIHYPFCRHLCDFCGYETRLLRKDQAAIFREKILFEIENYKQLDDTTNSSLRSVFFGGGTASLMPSDLLGECLRGILSFANQVGVPEVTLECEPGTIGSEKLKSAAEAGVNRISVCAQSLDNASLKNLGRKHSVSDALALIYGSISAGIRNIHLDLMYFIPYQSIGDWERTLKLAVELPITHISTYKLYIFKHGALHRNGSRRGEEELPEDTARAREMHEIAADILCSAGYEQYTLTEFARPEYKSEYIKSCFDGSSVLPIGPGAFGRCEREIWENQPYLSSYLSENKEFSSRGVTLTAVQAFKRDVILGLWLLEVDLEQLALRYKISTRPELVTLLNSLCDQGFITLSKGKVILDPVHRFQAGIVMARLDALPTELWALPSHESGSTSSTSVNSKETRKDLTQFAQLARVARRDRDLFSKLTENPRTTLRALGYDLFNQDIVELVNVIDQNGKYDTQSDLAEIRQFWAAIQGEHEIDNQGNEKI